MSVSSSDLQYIQSQINPTWDKVIHSEWVTKEKHGKVQKRILVITQTKLFTIRKSLVGSRDVRRVGGLVDLREVVSESSNTCTFRFSEFWINATSPAMDEIIKKLYSAYKIVSSGYPPKFACKFVISPAGRIAFDNSKTELLGQGFLATYKSACIKFNCKVDERFLLYWTDRLERGTAELDLSGSPGIAGTKQKMDLRPIAFALRYNSYFRGVRLENVPRKTVFTELHELLDGNTTIEELVIRGAHASSNGLDLLANVMDLAGPSGCNLSVLNLSLNPLKDKGARLVAKCIRRLRKLRELHLDACGFSSTGVVDLINDGFSKSKYLGKTLQILNLSHNKFGPLGTTAFNGWLVDCSDSGVALSELHLQDTQIVAKTFLASLSRYAPYLAVLDLGQNKIDKNSSIALEKFVKSSESLAELHLSRCSLRANHSSPILHGFTHNDKLQEGLCLNISFLNLGVKGMKQTIAALNGTTTLTMLLLDKANIGSKGLLLLIKAVNSIKTLETLSISKNVNHKNPEEVAKNLASLIVGHPNLSTVRVAGDKVRYFGPALTPVLQAIGVSKSLTELDITGNKFTDSGITTLAESLKTTPSLTALRWDGNDVSIDGIQSFRDALKRNNTLFDMRLPNATFKQILSATPKNQREHIQSRITELSQDITGVLKANRKGRQRMTAKFDPVHDRPLTMAPRTLSTYGIDLGGDDYDYEDDDGYNESPTSTSSSSTGSTGAPPPIPGSKPPGRPKSGKPNRPPTAKPIRPLSSASEAISQGDFSGVDDLIDAVIYDDDDSYPENAAEGEYYEDGYEDGGDEEYYEEYYEEGGEWEGDEEAYYEEEYYEE